MSDNDVENDAPDWLPAAVAVLLDSPCEMYDEPGQDCITAGPQVFGADGCPPCVARGVAAVRLRAGQPVPDCGPVADGLLQKYDVTWGSTTEKMKMVFGATFEPVSA